MTGISSGASSEEYDVFISHASEVQKFSPSLAGRKARNIFLYMIDIY